MQTGQHHHEPTKGWREAGVSREEWTRLESLLELVRQEHKRMELSPERREWIRERVMERFERNERRRRRWRAVAIGAGALLVAWWVAARVARSQA
jgi:ABC-type protease/lipase transport system fused ATPase/permease subunit